MNFEKYKLLKSQYVNQDILDGHIDTIKSESDESEYDDARKKESKSAKISHKKAYNSYQKIDAREIREKNSGK